MPKTIDLTGRIFGRLEVMYFTGRKNKSGSYLWHVKCICGNEKDISSSYLINKGTISCGCYHHDKLIADHTTHGKAGSKIYELWQQMVGRCHNPNHTAYKYYGARGIKVCERWQLFSNFYEDMGEKPEGKSLDRINNNGNYEPGNCRWATPAEQARNKGNSILIEYNGETKPLRDWSEELGINYDTLHDRITHLGYSIEKAFNTSDNRAKLSPDQVNQIRRIYAETGLTQLEISRIYGISRSHISKITRKSSVEPRPLPHEPN